MSSTWIFQDYTQVQKYGAERASFYIGWYDPQGRRRSKSCGPGEEGRQAAIELGQKLRRSLAARLYADPLDSRDPVTTELASEEVLATSGKSVVYFIEAVGMERIKIGTTSQLGERMKILQANCPVRVRVLAVVDGGTELECRFHKKFARFRLHGEWFQAARKLRLAIAALKQEAGLLQGEPS